jgi:hypothetical protein
MASGSDIDWVTEARRLAKLATELKLKLPTGLKAEDMAKDADKGQAALDELDGIRRSLMAKVNAKDAAIRKLREDIKRLRLGVKAEYGDNSDEYEKVGGTRASERKKPVSKKAAAV